MLHILHGRAVISQRKISVLYMGLCFNARSCSFDYIEANPVRKGLLEDPEDWEWSSARARRYKEGLFPDSDIPFLMN